MCYNDPYEDRLDIPSSYFPIDAWHFYVQYKIGEGTEDAPTGVHSSSSPFPVAKRESDGHPVVALRVKAPIGALFSDDR
jgi:hypothetical protein